MRFNVGLLDMFHGWPLGHLALAVGSLAPLHHGCLLHELITCCPVWICNTRLLLVSCDVAPSSNTFRCTYTHSLPISLSRSLNTGLPALRL